MLVCPVWSLSYCSCWVFVKCCQRLAESTFFGSPESSTLVGCASGLEFWRPTGTLDRAAPYTNLPCLLVSGYEKALLDQASEGEYEAAVVTRRFGVYREPLRQRPKHCKRSSRSPVTSFMRCRHIWGPQGSLDPLFSESLMVYSTG